MIRIVTETSSNLDSQIVQQNRTKIPNKSLLSRITSCFCCCICNQTPNEIQVVPTSSEFAIQNLNIVYPAPIENPAELPLRIVEAETDLETKIDSPVPQKVAYENAKESFEAEKKLLTLGQGCEVANITDFTLEQQHVIDSGIEWIHYIFQEVNIIKECQEDNIPLDPEILHRSQRLAIEALEVANEISNISHLLYKSDLEWLKTALSDENKELCLDLRTTLSLDATKYQLKTRLAALTASAIKLITDFCMGRITLEEYNSRHRDLYELQGDLKYTLEQVSLLQTNWESLSIENPEESYDLLIQIIQKCPVLSHESPLLN